jgi:hypothetical protein
MDTPRLFFIRQALLIRCDASALLVRFNDEASADLTYRLVCSFRTLEDAKLPSFCSELPCPSAQPAPIALGLLHASRTLQRWAFFER